MTGRSHQDVWLVIDVIDDPHPQRYSMHYGKPERPTVVVPGLGSRCRYEFLLQPGEGSAGEPPSFELIERLCRPFRSITPEQVVRAVNYRFNSLVADQWRRGRVFLAGDAAHMMPPFGGQGLNSGLRAVTSLSWKLVEVLAGRAGDSLLDTYEAERRPHAAQVVEFSRRMGRIVMTTSEVRARLRDNAVKVLLKFPAGRSYLEQMKFRPPQRITEGAVHLCGEKAARGFVGTIVSQPLVLPADTLRPTRLDQVTGNGFTVMGIDVPAEDWGRLPTGEWPWHQARLHDVVLGDLSPWRPGLINGLADADGTLQSDFQAHRGKFVLLRPDRIVAAVFDGGQAAETVSKFRQFGLPVSAVPDTAGDFAPAGITTHIKEGTPA